MKKTILPPNSAMTALERPSNLVPQLKHMVERGWLPYCSTFANSKPGVWAKQVGGLYWGPAWAWFGKTKENASLEDQQLYLLEATLCDLDTKEYFKRITDCRNACVNFDRFFYELMVVNQYDTTVVISKIITCAIQADLRRVEEGLKK